MLDPIAKAPDRAASDRGPELETEEAARSGGLAPSVQAQMGRAFGADFSDVRVHEDGQAQRIGAAAYTQGRDLHFAPGQYRPDTESGRELIGHELAHVVQQSQGRVAAPLQAKGAHINDDHGLEAEADALGARAARGERVADLRGAKVGESFAKVAQCYVEQKLAGKDWRVADDLNMAIRQDTTGPAYGSHNFFADPSLIASSSATLKAQNSRLEMTADSGQTMDVTDGKTTKTLQRVVPHNIKDGTAGNAKSGGMQWPDDCGMAANAVMQGDGFSARGVHGGGKTTKSLEYGTDSEEYRGNTMHTPHLMLDEILKAELDPDPDKARERYHKMSKKERDAFDKKAGINRYADPSIGEAYSIVSDKDEFADGKSAWNFHWGGVCMKSGGDHVTMENFAGSGGDAWDFQMYGSAKKKGQTFHEQQEERTHGTQDEYGPNPFTIRVRPD
jgi:hypothetical protein